MPKFFVPSEQPFGSALVLTGENAAHARVLRLKYGDSVTVCDAHGTDYACTVDSVQPGEVSLCVNASAPSASEPSVRCSVYMAYAKADKLEHVIQKATELGAAEIVAFPSARCVSRPDAQEFRIITVAVPLAAASRTTRPFVSNVDGKRNRSDLPYHARMISRSEIAPVKKQRSESFRSSA